MKHRQTLGIVACMAWFLALGRAQAAGQLVTKADLSPEESQEYVELLAGLLQWHLRRQGESRLKGHLPANLESLS